LPTNDGCWGGLSRPELAERASSQPGVLMVALRKEEE